MTEMIDSLVDELKRKPGEWATVRFAVEKGRQAARPFIRRGCLTRVLPTEGDEGRFDVYAMWPFVEQADGTLIAYVDATQPRPF